LFEGQSIASALLTQTWVIAMDKSQALWYPKEKINGQWIANVRRWAETRREVADTIIALLDEVERLRGLVEAPDADSGGAK
jgi:hypothetical protein